MTDARGMWEPDDHRIYVVVRKSRRRLELWQENRVILDCPIALGPHPVGPKRREGDGRTPEGEYYVCTRNEASRYYLSLGLSYPNRKDAETGLREGVLSEASYRQIAEAISREKRPPWDTAMGGAIMIHGMGAGRDWTAGCIALDNQDMDTLWARCPLGTRVFIWA